ncbi:hypothetical protein T06_14637 [Trichinella sp. T6]|nr:hypothetical protein T06_13384 [Trichinella sp. T6]KRX35637.1 hypothetical protein T06_3770 [Trichinella sp. T6]KRX35667.1 hypothetical protein T06_14637 [Trichinella sp. T6]
MKYWAKIHSNCDMLDCFFENIKRTVGLRYDSQVLINIGSHSLKSSFLFVD